VSALNHGSDLARGRQSRVKPFTLLALPAARSRCSYCPGVAFGYKSTLKTHTKTVHEKRRDDACPYCKGVAFGQKGSLTRHIDTVHLKIKRRSKRRAAWCGV